MNRTKHCSGLSIQKLLDKLTPLIPAKLDRVNHRSWTTGRVTLDMNYLSPPTGRDPRSLYPVSVTVRIANAAERSESKPGTDWNRCKIRCLTYGEKADGTFNVTAIAAAVARLTKSYYAFEVEEADRKQQERARAVAHINLVRSLGPVHGYRVQKNGVTTTGITYAGSRRISLRIDKLSVLEAQKVMDLVKSFERRDEQ